nr:MAG TPA: 43 kDa tail protein [Caudoviricetes sp.]
MSEKNELQHLQNVLKKVKPAADIEATEKEINRTGSADVSVVVFNGKKTFTLPVKDGMKIVWERKGAPGKLTFSAKMEKKFKIEEGNEVSVIYGKTKMFFGYIFTKKLSKDGIVDYTAYDQLRYLKNKDILVYKRKTADEVVSMIAKRFNLRCGTLAKTGYRMSAIEDNSTLFDIIQNALDNTLGTKNKVYVLYDQIGKLRLVDVSKMKVNSCLVDAETGEDFTYTSTIDSDVYNQIKLIYENKKKGTFDLYVARSSKTIHKWGVLQYTDKINSPDIGKLKCNALLKYYNRKKRTLTISGVIGNSKVRGGSLVPVLLNLGDFKVANYMMVEKVTHTFNNRQYTMDLVVSGGDFSE